MPADKTQTTNIPAANPSPPAANSQQIEAPAAGIIRPAVEGKHAKRVRKQTSTDHSLKR